LYLDTLKDLQIGKRKKKTDSQTCVTQISKRVVEVVLASVKPCKQNCILWFSTCV